MTREEKILMAIKKGYVYNPETGQIFGVSGKELISTHCKGYRLINLTFGKTYVLLAHQFAWYWVHKEILERIDHINEIKHDNRIVNLRPLTNQENLFNTSNRKGYYYDKNSKKFVSKIMVFGKNITLGRHDNKQDARSSYLKGKEYFHVINDNKLLKERFANINKYFENNF